MTDCEEVYRHYKDRCLGLLEEEVSSLNPETQVILAYDNDEIAREAVSLLIRQNIKFIPCEWSCKRKPAEYFHLDQIARKTLIEEVAYSSEFFDMNDFQEICQALRITKNCKGDYLEIGTFRGDSAKVALNYMKKSGINRNSYFFDTFGGFNYQEAWESSDNIWKGAFSDTSEEFVRRRLKKYNNALLYKGNIIADDLPKEITSIAVCNIDVDIWDAVYAALKKVTDKLVINGIIIVEDYGHTPTMVGTQYAVHKFLEEHAEEYISIYLISGQIFLIKKA